MARGITETDVWNACDALLLEGARPTIERVRQKIGRGSPNTVSPFLETWFKHLGARIADPGAFAVPLDVPDPIQQAAKHFWERAQSESRKDFDDRLREAMAAAVENVEAEKEKARVAEAAAYEATARAGRLEEELAGKGEALEAERRERVATETRLAAAHEQLTETRQRLDIAVADIAAIRQAAQAEVSAALTRSTASERRAAFEIDAERQARAKVDRRAEILQKKLEDVQAELVAANERALRGSLVLEAQVSTLQRDVSSLNDLLSSANRRNGDLEVEVAIERRAAAEFRGAVSVAQEMIQRLTVRATRPKARARVSKVKDRAPAD